MANLADDFRDDTDGPLALVVADDDGLRESLPDVVRELGFGVVLCSSQSISHATLGGDQTFALALLCIGRGLPAHMRYLGELLTSPALVGADILIATTASPTALSTLPDAERAASIAFLRMPFEFCELEPFARPRVAVAQRSPVLLTATGACDRAVDAPRRSPALVWTLWEDECFPADLTGHSDDCFAQAC